MLKVHRTKLEPSSFAYDVPIFRNNTNGPVSMQPQQQLNHLHKPVNQHHHRNPQQIQQLKEQRDEVTTAASSL